MKAGLSRDYADAIDGLENIEGSFKELDAAAGAILELGGFLKPASDVAER